MANFLKSEIGRLRLLAFLEGTSLVFLLFIAVPLKYYFEKDIVKFIGPAHGILFILYVIKVIQFGIENNWKFTKTTWKVLIACIIPFGTFYIDYQVLKKY